MSEKATAAVPKSTRQGKIAAAAGPVLSLAFVLRQSRDLDQITDLDSKVNRLFDEFRSSARDQGIASQDIDDACYALAAAIDETLLLAEWGGREAWQRNSLAKRYCNDEFVGLGFYDKLTQIRRGTVPRTDVVEVFYYCLVSGFRGKLAESPKELGDLMDELARELSAGDTTLSPHALPRSGRMEPLTRFPWMPIVITCVALPFLVWLLVWNLLDGKAERIVETLKTISF